MGGEGVTNRLTLQAVLAHNRILIDKKQKEFIDRIFELTYRQILDNINQAQKQILEAVNRMSDVINRTDKSIEQVQNHLQNMTRRHQELNDVIEVQYFEKETDGNYKSKVITNTIAAYEQRTDEKLSDNITPEMLILILRSQEDFEKTVVVPKLENELVKLDTFRGNAQEQKESFEEESQRLDDELKAIDADESLTEEERRDKKIEILEQASKTALDAEMEAQNLEKEYVELLSELQEEKYSNEDSFYHEHSNNESLDLNQSALDELPDIKPLLVPSP